MTRTTTRHRRRSAAPASLLASPWTWLALGALLVAGGLLAFAAQGQAGLSGSAGAASNAYPAPDFRLAALDGSSLALSDHRGRYVLLNFWATWCPPCRAELPDLVRFYQDHADQGFILIGVNEQEPPAAVADFLRAQGLAFPVALDADGALLDRYGVQGMPSSFLVDPQGRVVHAWTGMIDRRTLEAAVTPLLEGQG